MAKKYGIPIRAIVPKDKLPKHPVNGAWIINLQDDVVNGINEMGTHWTALWIEEGGAVYADSFGFPAPSDVEVFIHKRFHDYLYNTKQVQDITTAYCGRYAILFLVYMMKNKHKSLQERLDTFQNLWDTNTKKNLSLLKRYLRE